MSTVSLVGTHGTGTEGVEDMSVPRTKTKRVPTGQAVGPMFLMRQTLKREAPGETGEGSASVT